MPYVSVADYERLRALTRPKLRSPSNRAIIERLETQLYELNKRIRALPDNAPEHDWRPLLQEHSRLLAMYREAGGGKL